MNKVSLSQKTLHRSGKLLIFTCEHGGNKIPLTYKKYFKNAGPVLKTHRGLDIGILPVAKQLSQKSGAELHFSETSRLLIDLNRDFDHRTAFSEFTTNLSPELKEQILKDHYYPYRSKVEKVIFQAAARKPVFHFSMHSFTPRLHGETRNCEIGLLYDPARHFEKHVAKILKAHLREVFPDLRLRMNYPYKGNQGGFVSTLRNGTRPEFYSGIEIEINQRLLLNMKASALKTFNENLHWTIESTIEESIQTRP